MKSKNKEKFQRLVSNETSKWHSESEWRERNKSWLVTSFQIAIRILMTLKDRSITQRELATRMSVSPQHINKILKGQENLSLETIFKLEEALRISLIDISTSLSYNQLKLDDGTRLWDQNTNLISASSSSYLFEYDKDWMTTFEDSPEHVMQKIAA